MHVGVLWLFRFWLGSSVTLLVSLILGIAMDIVMLRLERLTLPVSLILGIAMDIVMIWLERLALLDV